MSPNFGTYRLAVGGGGEVAARPGVRERGLRLLLALAAGVGIVASVESAAFAQQANTAGNVSASGSGPAADCGPKAEQGFVDRFVGAYADHLNVTGEESGPEPAHRDAPLPPLSSPPFPTATWTPGGSPPIGYEGMVTGPLMDAIYCGRNGQAIKDSRITVYGWIDPGFNLSTSHNKYSISQGLGGNGVTAYDVYPNTVQLDQAVLYFERVPDTVQTDHVDWGFRVANLYGTDYKYTFSHGILSNQYIVDHHVNGYDPVMVYVDLYFPGVADGTNVRIGRYISVPDIEAQLAPNNYTYSHSLLYTVDPYTQTGMVGTFKLDKNWTVQLGISGGDDVAPWDPSATPTGLACVNWTSDSGNDNLYPCVNSINGGHYAYNNLQDLVATWYHKFNEQWHMATEAYYMWEDNVPNVSPNAPPTAPPTIPNANGAFCKATQATCTAAEYAIVNYVQYRLTPKDYLSFRNDMLNDLRGQRTGFPTLYTETTLSWNHWIGDVITFRPELRFDHSWTVPAYDGGHARNQLTFAGDVIVHF